MKLGHIYFGARIRVALPSLAFFDEVLLNEILKQQSGINLLLLQNFTREIWLSKWQIYILWAQKLLPKSDRGPGIPSLGCLRRLAASKVYYTYLNNISYILRGQKRGFLETYQGCFLRNPVVSKRRRFWSVDQYGLQRPSLIFLTIESSQELLKEFRRNFTYAFFSWSSSWSSCGRLWN